MAKLVYDTTGVDPNKPTGFEPYEGPVPKPGVYWGEIMVMRTAEGKDSGNTYLKVMYKLGPNEDPEKNKCAGAPIWDNVVPGEHELQQARLAQLLNAVCGKPKAIVLTDDNTNEVKTIGGKKPVGTRVKLVLQRESYQDQPQARVSDVFPLPKDVKWPTGPVDSSDEELEEEDVEEEAEEDGDAFEARKEELEGMTLVKLKLEAKKVEGAKTTGKASDIINSILDIEYPPVEEDEEEESEEVEEDEEAEEEVEDEDPAAERREELSSKTRTQLKVLVKKADPDFKVTTKTTDDEIREAIIAAEFPDAEEEAEEDVDPQEERRAELSAMSRVQIKKVLIALDPDYKVLKSATDADLVEAVLEREVDTEPPF